MKAKITRMGNLKLIPESNLERDRINRWLSELDRGATIRECVWVEKPKREILGGL